jgi:hypothetical protein
MRYRNIISQEMCSLSNSIKHHTRSLLWQFNNTRIKYPISCHKTPVQNDGRQNYFTAFPEELNYAMSPLKNSYQHISSVTISSSNRHEVYAGCLLSRHFFFDILTLGMGPIGYTQNNVMELPLYTGYNSRRQQVQKHVQFQCVFPSGECLMVE